MSDLSLYVSEGRRVRRMQSHVCKHKSLLVVVLAQYLVLTQIKSIPNAKSEMKTTFLIVHDERHPDAYYIQN